MRPPQNLERLTTDLTVMCDWRDELQGKVRRAELRAEFYGLSIGEQQDLEDEVAEFSLICHRLLAPSGGHHD